MQTELSKMRYVPFFFWLLLSSFAFLPANRASATDSCSLLVNSALDVTHQLCNGTPSNQVCYGHHQVEAEPQPGFGPFRFAQVGDKLDVVGLQSLRLSPMSTTTDNWGVAWMNVEANLPGTKSVQDVTFLVLGDVQIINQVRGTKPIEATVVTVRNVNIRQAPTLNANVLGTL